MTTPDQPVGRPVPDTDDLRLLAEIINNGSIGLPQAAWNARMSQGEAAARFVTMAERGMPLRLVAEGDRQLLWQIAQAGPATGGFPLPDAAAEVAPAPAVAGPEPDLAPPAAIEPQPVQQLPVAPPLSPPPLSPPPPPAAPAAPPAALPPASAVPPHEQAIAGAVPLGQPPFGTPPAPEADSAVQAEQAPADSQPAADTPSPEAPPAEAPLAEAPPAEAPVPEPAPAPAPQTGSGETWGVPGIATWARTDEPAAPPPAPVVTPLPPLFPPSVLADFGPPAPHDPQPSMSRHATTDDPPAAPPASASPTRRVMISGQPTQNMTGLFGEHLSISLQQIVDPADQILTQAGYRLDPGERALLVQTSIGNQGPIDYESLPDLYLVLVSSTGEVLQKAAMAVAQFPAHRVGLPAGANASGWTVFLVPVATEVAEVRWSVRPDLVNRTVSWGFGPA